jgi:adenosylcobinamide-GDP ribazoletransferase
MDSSSSSFTATLAGWRRDVAVATRFLTRLPLPETDAEGRPLAEAARAFPLVGFVVGALAAIALLVAHQFGWHPLACALVALAVAALATGALHEDGLADVADGFGGGATREDKLAIMRDSRIGTYGVLALLFVLGLRVGALVTFAEGGAAAMALIAAHAFARSLLPTAMRMLAPARGDGLGFSAGRPDRDGALTAAVLGALLALLFLGLGAGLVAIVAASLAALLFGWIAWRQVGGHTGDVLGALEQVAETALLLAAAAVLA